MKIKIPEYLEDFEEIYTTQDLEKRIIKALKTAKSFEELKQLIRFNIKISYTYDIAQNGWIISITYYNITLKFFMLDKEFYELPRNRFIKTLL